MRSRNQTQRGYEQGVRQSQLCNQISPPSLRGYLVHQHPLHTGQCSDGPLQGLELTLAELRRENSSSSTYPARQPTPEKCSAFWSSCCTTLELAPAFHKQTRSSYGQTCFNHCVGCRNSLDIEKAPGRCTVRFSSDLFSPKLTPVSPFLSFWL